MGTAENGFDIWEDFFCDFGNADGIVKSGCGAGESDIGGAFFFEVVGDFVV